MDEQLAWQVDSFRSWQEDLYRDFHAHPELSGQETRTADAIARELEQLDYDVRRVGGGVVGVLENGEGSCVLFRADIDALPVKEDTGLPYASTATAKDDSGHDVPVMHACGHDIHITAGLGAARWMSEQRDQWQGTYVALFQPAEETASGAQGMVDDGLADAIPKPVVALGQHVLAEPWAGQVAVNAGPMLSTGACIRVTVHGKGTHGSMPHLGIDPIVLAASIVQRLQTLVSRETAPGEFAVMTVGSLRAGSTANIIPDSAELLLNIRAYDEGVRQRLLDGIDRIVRAECTASRCPKDPDIEVYQSYPLTDNDAAAADKVRAAFEAALGEDHVVTMNPATASEDFSVVPRALDIPYCYWGVGGFEEGSTTYPNHNPRFAPVLQPTLQTATMAAVAAVRSAL